MLVGSLQESYHRFQLALSSRLARYLHALGDLPPVLSARIVPDVLINEAAICNHWHADCRERPEMTELLCVEVMTRQLHASAAVHQHAVLAALAALAPWMDNLSFAARWEGAVLLSLCCLSGHALH